MISPESFLKNLHVGLPREQRLALEAVGFAFEGLGYAYARLREGAARLAEASPQELQTMPLVPLFADAWAIIDYSHMARKLISTLKPRQELRSYCDETEIATLLRNRAHHIHNSLKNLSAKAAGPPLFGALSFAILEDGDLVETSDGSSVVRGWRAMVIPAGKPVEMLHRVAEGPAGEVRIEIPIGRFGLEAFDRFVNISELFFSAQRAVVHFDTKVAAGVESAVRKASLAAGLDPDEQLKHTGVAFVFDMRVAMEDEPATVTALPYAPIILAALGAK